MSVDKLLTVVTVTTTTTRTTTATAVALFLLGCCCHYVAGVADGGVTSLPPSPLLPHVVDSFVVANNPSSNMRNDLNNNNSNGKEQNSHSSSNNSSNNYNNNNNSNNNNDDNSSNTTTLENAIASSERKLRRGKRYLDFVKGSRMSWRTTAKNNILTVNTLWGYGYGFRVNFPFPDKEDRRRPFFKRDLFHAMEDILGRHGFDGRACVLKSYCAATLDGADDGRKNGGMLFKLLQMLFSLTTHDQRHLPYLNVRNCAQILHNHCPLDFDSLSPYTDDV